MTDKERQFRPHLPHTRKEKALVMGSFVGFFAAAAAARGLLHHREQPGVSSEPGREPDWLQRKTAILLGEAAAAGHQELADLNRMAALFAVRSSLPLAEVRRLFAPARTRSNEARRTVSRTLVALSNNDFIRYGSDPAAPRARILEANGELYAYLGEHEEDFPDFTAQRLEWERQLSGEPSGNS